MQIEENHPIRARTPISYPPNFQIGLDIDSLNDTNRRFADWNQKETKNLKYLIQLIRILGSLLRIIGEDLLPIYPFTRPYTPGLEPKYQISFRLAESGKAETTKQHYCLLASNEIYLYVVLATNLCSARHR